MQARFEYPWLQVGDVARISVEGKGEAKSKIFTTAGNLVESLIEFIDLVLEDCKFSGSVSDTCNHHTILKVYLEGKYRVDLAIPCQLWFRNAKETIYGNIGVARDGAVYGSLRVKNATFTETIPGYGGEISEKLIELGAKHKIYYPLYMLQPVANDERLSFYTPDGELVFEISDKGYSLNYEAFGGSVRKWSGVVVKWLEDTILRNFNEDLENADIGKTILKAKAGNFEVLYNTSEKRVIDFKFLQDGLTITLIGDNIKISDSSRRIEVYVVGAQIVRDFVARISEKLWHIFKPLVF